MRMDHENEPFSAPAPSPSILGTARVSRAMSGVSPDIQGNLPLVPARRPLRIFAEAIKIITLFTSPAKTGAFAKFAIYLNFSRAPNTQKIKNSPKFPFDLLPIPF